ncbi:hypothetical protein J5X84_28450 [Streptosporangiaceae bacterium NEAU-GS5]|nr:hypothetical protein [Streptosporangiaceae bacterium NEAU-GS5]
MASFAIEVVGQVVARPRGRDPARGKPRRGGRGAALVGADRGGYQRGRRMGEHPRIAGDHAGLGSGARGPRPGATDGGVRGVLEGHTGSVTTCAFSPDGELLATTGSDRTARLWRVADGTEWAVLTGHTNWPRDCAFSPDGSLLATVSRDGTLRLRHVRPGVVTVHCASAPVSAASPGIPTAP